MTVTTFLVLLRSCTKILYFIFFCTRHSVDLSLCLRLSLRTRHVCSLPLLFTFVSLKHPPHRCNTCMYTHTCIKCLCIHLDVCLYGHICPSVSFSSPPFVRRVPLCLCISDRVEDDAVFFGVLNKCDLHHVTFWPQCFSRCFYPHVPFWPFWGASPFDLPKCQ